MELKDNGAQEIKVKDANKAKTMRAQIIMKGSLRELKITICHCRR